MERFTLKPYLLFCVILCSFTLSILGSGTFPFFSILGSGTNAPISWHVGAFIYKGHKLVDNEAVGSSNLVYPDSSLGVTGPLCKVNPMNEKPFIDPCSSEESEYFITNLLGSLSSINIELRLIPPKSFLFKIIAMQGKKRDYFYIVINKNGIYFYSKPNDHHNYSAFEPFFNAEKINIDAENMVGEWQDYTFSEVDDQMLFTLKGNSFLATYRNNKDKGCIYLQNATGDEVNSFNKKCEKFNKKKNSKISWEALFSIAILLVLCGSALAYYVISRRKNKPPYSELL